jgi:hypothetical protein
MSAKALATTPVDQLPVAPAASESAAILSVIERMALSQDIDPDRVERFMGMYERMEAQKAQKVFFAAFSAAQAEMPQVVRNAVNDQTRSKYAKYETISEAIQPVITKHGFSMTYGEADSPKENCLRITCTLMHEAGHSKDYHADIPVDMYGMKGNPNKTGPHAYGSTKSYGRRYLKLDIWDIAVKNEDDDGNAAGRVAPVQQDTISEEQVAELLMLIERSKGTVEKFCQLGKIESVPELLSVHFDAAKAMLMERINRIEAKAKPTVNPNAQFDQMERGDA